MRSKQKIWFAMSLQRAPRSCRQHWPLDWMPCAGIRICPGIGPRKPRVTGHGPTSAGGASDRTFWKRKIQVATASNELLWDWLHCARDRWAELDALIEPPPEATRDLLLRQNRGKLLIASHFGAPTAGVYYLCNGGFPVKLLGRELKSAALANTDYVINSESRYFLRDVYRTLDAGWSVIVAAEAVAGRNLLEISLPGGARLKVMGWIPKLIWRERFGSLFLFPNWENGKSIFP